MATLGYLFRQGFFLLLGIKNQEYWLIIKVCTQEMASNKPTTNAGLSPTISQILSNFTSIVT